MGLARLQGFMCRLAPRAIGLPAAHRGLCFHLPRRFLDPTVHRLSRIGFIPSCLVSPSEFLRPSPCRSFRSCRPAGVSSLFATSPLASTITGLPGSPLRSVLRFLQPLDGLRRPRLRGLIASRCHVQGFHRSGGSPDPQPHRLVTGSCPRAVVLRALTGKPAATLGGLDFEALLRGPMRSSRQGVSLPRGRSPLRLSPPSGPGSPVVSPVPRVLRSWRFVRRLPTRFHG